MADLLSNTDYRSIIAEATSKIGDILGQMNVNEPTTTKVSGSSYNGPNIGNLLNGTLSNVQALVQGDDQQKASAIQDILSDLKDLFANFKTQKKSAIESFENDYKAALYGSLITTRKIYVEQLNASLAFQKHQGGIPQTVEE